MFRLFVAFFILLASVLLGIQLKADPGYVLIAINHWRLETTLWVAVFAIILLLAITHILLQLISKLLTTPRTLNKWHAQRLAQKAQATTRRGLIEYSEGYWKKAQNHLIQALPNTDTPLLNYLTAARAAQKMGDSQLRDHYLREAQQSMPEAKIAVELTQAQLQLANNQWEQALATLRHLQDLAPKHPYVLKLLMNLYQNVRDWTHLINLLPDLKKNKIVNEDEFYQLQKNCYLQAISDLIKQNQPDAVISLYKSLPKNLNNESEIIAEYTHFLIKMNELHQAEDLLRQCLKRKFDSLLVELYGTPLNLQVQLPFAESLLKKNPHSAILYLSLGRLCIAHQLWGKAKHYLEQSIELTPSPMAYNELGILYEQLNDPHWASESFKKGLNLVTKIK